MSSGERKTIEKNRPDKRQREGDQDLEDQTLGVGHANQVAEKTEDKAGTKHQGQGTNGRTRRPAPPGDGVWHAIFRLDGTRPRSVLDSMASPELSAALSHRTVIRSGKQIILTSGI